MLPHQKHIVVTAGVKMPITDNDINLSKNVRYGTFPQVDLWLVPPTICMIINLTGVWNGRQHALRILI